MPSRREQIQSYQYLMQRVVNAFIAGETDPAMSPLRRLVGAGYASVMITVLALAVVGVIGVLKHGGNTSWRDDKAVIIEKETGTRYVYRDGVLYPVANYASALLALGGDAGTVSVSRESLLSASRGPLIGIAGAPDALPPASRLLSTPWSICAQAGQDQTGAANTTSLLLVGRTPTGGTALGRSGALVRDAVDSKVYLIWNGHRFRVNSRLILSAMGIDQQKTLLVDSAWLDAVPLGAPIEQITVDGRGQASQSVKGMLVGQVLSVTGGGDTVYYLVRKTDVLPLTAIEEAITLADPATASAYPGATPTVKQVPAATIATATKANKPTRTDASAPTDVPPMLPEQQDAALCSTFTSGATGPQFVVNADRITDGTGIATNGSDTSAVVDRIVVPSGYGAIVQADQSPDATAGTLFLVTDQGKRYSIPNPQQLSWFGYAGIKPIALPSYVVARMPTGPSLDPQVAQRPVAGS